MSVERLPPASLLLVHGAGSGPWVYDGWADEFASVPVLPIDLHEGLEVAHASMADYADRVVGEAAKLATPVALCGWSLGGLVVLQAAERVAPHSVILLEASAPAEIQGFNADADLTQGTFDPEAVYGPFPPGVRARPESSLARGERKRGISVPSLRCASLVVYGDDFREERGLAIARLYGSRERYIPGLDHWGVVQDRRVREAIAEFLGILLVATTAKGDSNHSILDPA
jgi:pimeloyl-ACP methyl ester carboxylesterase